MDDTARQAKQAKWELRQKRKAEKEALKKAEEERLFAIRQERFSRYMKEALKEARKAFRAGDVPVGCVIVRGDEIIARACNRRMKNKSALAHAEILAIKKAEKAIDDWRLVDCEVYVTLEPCQMCAGALVQARAGKVIIGAMSPKSGCGGSLLNLLSFPGFNHRAEVTTGVLAEDCAKLLSTFFENQVRKEELEEP